MNWHRIEHSSVEERKILAKEYNKNFPLSLWEEDYFASFIVNNPQKPVGFFIKDGKKIIGGIVGWPVANKQEVFCLSILWVAEKFRGKKIGQKLVQGIITEVKKDKKIKEMIVHFRQSNNLQNFYCQLGFSNFMTAGAYSNGEVKCQMQMAIN